MSLSPGPPSLSGARGRGSAFPQGATLTPGGANFAVYSEDASAVSVSLFDEAGGETRHPLEARTGHVWHGFIPGVRAGQRYGLRVHGPFDPARGLRFDPTKVLVDPYARAIDGKYDHATGKAPRCVVVGDDELDWDDDTPPQIAWRDTLVYELHVKGFTKLHPDVPEHERGTYLGLAHESVVRHLLELGVTAVELLPVHECSDEHSVARRGMKNYWGYSTLGYFAPDQRFASRPGRQVAEFKQMVRGLHAAGIEVILDVVYNHTCECGADGTTLSLRGIDNRTYYRLRPDDPSRYVDWTGCGNTLDLDHPQTLKLVTDSLRYWVTEMHVDGFRFDLAPVLGRTAPSGAFDRGAAFFDVLYQDPVLSRVKLIAEPWDLAPEAMPLGRFPVGWREWNAYFRDEVRGFWNGHSRAISHLGYRLSGSSDLFGARGRGPTASINFVTAHDGFTLRDLVSYEKKHNLANGEADRDGTGHNLSMSFGVEGDTDDLGVLAQRARQVRNLLGTLLLAPGVPMLVAGDEMGRTQHGNNNPFVLDDPTSWVKWALDGDQRDLLTFTRAIVGLRRELPGVRRTTFFRGAPTVEGGPKDVAWLRPSGGEIQAGEWEAPEACAVGALYEGALLLLLNAEASPCAFRLPGARERSWRVLVDTRSPRVPYGGTVRPGSEYELLPRSLALLRLA